jgi:hypothetical protein
MTMNKTLTALAAAATIAVTAIAVPQQAEARWRHGGGAVIGGLAAGALIGGALAGGYGYYGGYRPYYGGYGPAYAGYDYGPYAYGACFRERVMTPWGWRWRRICR